MHDHFIKLAGELNKKRKPYATAIIVNRKIPSSGKPGDKAIITTNGEIHGWIGGGCTRGIVLKESLLSIQENKPRMVRISPEEIELDDMNTKLYQMTCQSGGAVDVYIEPVLPRPHLVVFGQSHIAAALTRIASVMQYRVTAIDNADFDEQLVAGVETLKLNEFSEEILDETSHLVVCTQGVGDLAALQSAIDTNAPYIAFVSSRKKAQSLFTELRTLGISIDRLKQIKTPAGLDIHAKLPEEVAISILAQIIQEIRGAKHQVQTVIEETELNLSDYYINPVCQIPVQKSQAKHILNYQDEQIYFCCDGCKIQFEAEPEKYMKS